LGVSLVVWNLSSERPVLPSHTLMMILTYNRSALNCFLIMCSTVLAWMGMQISASIQQPWALLKVLWEGGCELPPRLKPLLSPKMLGLLPCGCWVINLKSIYPRVSALISTQENILWGGRARPLISIMNFCLPKVPALLLERNQYSSSLFVAQWYRYFRVFCALRDCSMDVRTFSISYLFIIYTV